MPSLAITEKIHRRLRELIEQNNIQHIEALGNIILILALNDENIVKHAVNLIKNWNLDKGAKVLQEQHGL